MLLRKYFILYFIQWLPGDATAKWVEGHIDTKENWAFLSRFCFLSLEGQFEYLIEFDKDMGIPNLLLYYDEEPQWPSVYRSSKTCKEREAVLNKAGQNQVVRLSHWYPDTEYSGCVIRRDNHDLPAAKSSTTTTTQKPTIKKTNNTNTTNIPPEPSYYDQFLKTTTSPKTTVIDTNSTTWYEILPTDDLVSTTADDQLWESVAGLDNSSSQLANLIDVELLFPGSEENGKKIKRSSPLFERFRRRRLNAQENQNNYNSGKERVKERLIVSCHNTRRFRSARERWWYIAISNCDSEKGLDIRYKFLVTNGPDGDFWHEHFSADEVYVLPVLLAYFFAYVIVMIAVVMCSVELKCRHLLHSTYKLFLLSVVSQHCGVGMQVLAYIKYAVNGFGGEAAKICGQFVCGVSEMSFLLMLILLAKGYTITRGRLKVGFTVKLTVFMCCYFVTYVTLFIYQAKAFDPGEVLYLYSSVVGYCVIGLRIVAWFAFAYATFFTVQKFPEKNMFYCPFFICGTLWFNSGPLFILTANNYIDKWVRESVVTAVLLFIAFSGHIMFLLLTLPVFANKNFPYHVRTTQIGIMEVTGNAAIDNFGHNAYHPTAAPQTVIIPLTRRTEELIGNMYSQYMSAPALNGTPKLNGLPNITSLTPQNDHRLNNENRQSSTDTNSSNDIRPILKNGGVFTVEGNVDNNVKNGVFAVEGKNMKDGVFTVQRHEDRIKDLSPSESIRSSHSDDGGTSRASTLPPLKPQRTILNPIKMDVPSWSLAKGPSVVAAVLKKKTLVENTENPDTRNGNISTISGNLSQINSNIPAANLNIPTANLNIPTANGNIPTVNSNIPTSNGNIPTSNGNIPTANGNIHTAIGNIPTDNSNIPTSNGNMVNLKKVPGVRNGLPSSGEISTILEGHVPTFANAVSKATLDLFTAGSKKI